jgi:hypothetical protein
MSGDFMSTLQDLISEVIPSQKYSVGVGVILNGYGASEPYSGRRITLSFSYVIETGEGKMERARDSKTAKSLFEHKKCN